MGKGYVLIVEDDRDICDSISEALEMEEINVKLAFNGEEGIAALASNVNRPPAVVLLDLMMPKTDGLWFCNERNKHAKYSEIPIVMMSADSQVEVKTRGLGVSKVLKKPIGITELIDTVREYL